MYKGNKEKENKKSEEEIKKENEKFNFMTEEKIVKLQFQPNNKNYL